MLARLFMIFTFFMALTFVKYDKDYREVASFDEPQVSYDAMFKY